MCIGCAVTVSAVIYFLLTVSDRSIFYSHICYISSSNSSIDIEIIPIYQLLYALIIN